MDEGRLDGKLLRLKCLRLTLFQTDRALALSLIPLDPSFFMQTGKTEEEACDRFLDLIRESLDCKTTRVNHAIHLMAKG